MSWWRAGLALVIVLMMLFVVACGGDDDDNAAAPTEPAATVTVAEPSGVPTGLSGDLTIFAAASLTDAFGQIKDTLEGANPDLSIEYNFAGSQQLAMQLGEGAGADVFASANKTQMASAQDADRIATEPVIFVRNRLAIIVPSDNPAGIESPADLANEGLKLVVANPDVPVGGYTLDMLDKMSADPAFGADFRSRVEANFVSLENNVKQVVTKVQLGEADAGVVYVSDVTPDVRADVRFIEIPAAFNVIAEYPIAAISDGDRALAQAFIDFLLSATGQAALEEWGFTPLDS
jgi:molybdate transport system substrate-binding protein